MYVCMYVCVSVINLYAAQLETGQRYKVHLWQVSLVYFEIMQVQLYKLIGYYKVLKKCKRKIWEKRNICISSPGLDIGRK